MAVFVDIDFETGDLSQFASTTGSNLTVTPDAAMASSSYGMEVELQPGFEHFGLTPEFVWTSRYLNIRFYLNTKTLAMASGDRFFMTDLTVAAAPTATLGRTRILYDTSPGFRIESSIVDDSIERFTGEATLPTNEPVLIEIAIVRASTNTASDGSVSLYVNESLEAAMTGLDLFDRTRPERMEFGSFSGVDAGTSGVICLDNLKITDDGALIGPVQSARSWFMYRRRRR